VTARRPRADAKRNRERVLEVAQRVFAAEGFGVPIDEIARRSGLGIGTLYRHFPTKQALVLAIMTERTTRVADRATELADAPDPEAAFFELLELVVDMVQRKKDLGDTLAGVDMVAATAKPRLQLRAAFQRLLARAQAAGAIRADLEIDDVLALVTATAPSPHRPSGSAPRLLAVIRDGLRVPRKRR
jgi:AcrR family transcriptional regulator